MTVRLPSSADSVDSEALHQGFISDFETETDRSSNLYLR